jgi:hypothetical protein
MTKYFKTSFFCFWLKNVCLKFYKDALKIFFIQLKINVRFSFFSYNRKKFIFFTWKPTIILISSSPSQENMYKDSLNKKFQIYIEYFIHLILELLIKFLCSIKSDSPSFEIIQKKWKKIGTVSESLRISKE